MTYFAYLDEFATSVPTSAGKTTGTTTARCSMRRKLRPFSKQAAKRGGRLVRRSTAQQQRAAVEAGAHVAL